MEEERRELKGGAYEVIDGERRLVQVTRDHPDGNRGPRDASGKLRLEPGEPSPQELATLAERAVEIPAEQPTPEVDVLRRKARTLPREVKE